MFTIAGEAPVREVVAPIDAAGITAFVNESDTGALAAVDDGRAAGSAEDILDAAVRHERADRGAALGERIEVLERRLHPRASQFHLRRVAGELLAQRDRGGILQMGATDLGKVFKRQRLLVQRIVQRRQSFRGGEDDDACGDLERGAGERIPGGDAGGHHAMGRWAGSSRTHFPRL